MKTLDWSKLANVNFDDSRREKLGIMTGKQMFQKAYARMEAQEQQENLRKSIEPHLRQMLLDHMINRKPLKVLMPFQNPTETLGGIAVDEEDDGFYANISKSADSAQRTAKATFETVMETVPNGIELVFKSLDKQLGQWLFKGSNGRDYAIYDHENIRWDKDQIIKNPGFFGLLYNTHLRQELGV